MYEYRAVLDRIVDGDTLYLEVDLGFDVRRKDSFRLYGINAPELNTEEGVAAANWLAETLGVSIDTPHPVITVTTHKDRREKFGRYLATLWVDIGGTLTNVNELMIAKGVAKAYL